MVRLRRWTLALLLCSSSVVLGPGAPASAAPATNAGVGTVVADLGAVPSGTPDPGFSFDGAYYAYLSPARDRCDLHLYDLKARKSVELVHNQVACDPYAVDWAAHADSLQWQVSATSDDVTAYAWDADPGQVSVLAPDAHVFDLAALSADGRFFSFTGRSDTHPAPSVDDPRHAAYVYDRTTGVSLPLSKPDLHVQLVGWSPRGANFVAQTGGHTSFDAKTGGCLGTGTACRDFTTVTFGYGAAWSRDGTAVLGGLVGNTVYDFTDRTLSGFPKSVTYVGSSEFVGDGADRVLGNLARGGTALWNRSSGTAVKVSDDFAFPSPTGRYLLTLDARPDVYGYRNLASGASAPATFRGHSFYGSPYGFWTQTGSGYLGIGPGGCSSLRQWSPATNTVSLFGPPGAGTCYRSASELGQEPLSSASGRFALVAKQHTRGATHTRYYVADLRRHVLLGPLSGDAGPFAPAGPDVLAIHQPLASDTDRLLLVDPTPVPDVDDKPRWSAATPATGTRIDARAGAKVHLQLGASDRQQTPVNLYLRWRTTAGTPVASAPKGWSCERRRLLAGATVADCTFAPPHDHTAPRFLDVSVKNYATGAQSDTRSYRVKVTPATGP